MTNRLAEESSPYLLQHAENPVDWYPWGPEALERARSEDRPILLSVGYSSCHWCHVMERESFEDPAIAALMNELYVNIKVDREERPDIDQIYMKAVQAMSGRGGWPMTVFLTPEGVPFFGGTYYPPEPRPGIPSFPDVLTSIAEAWETRRAEVEAGGARLLDALRQTMERNADGPDVGLAVVDGAVESMAQRYDPTHGGFGPAPKFPQPVGLELLLRHFARTGGAASLEMAVHTLRRMAAGGMRDHLAGGFHRYSVDARWLVPHFEKMLYDNALLARVYLDAWKLTGSDDLADVAVEVLDDLATDLRDPAGGFHAARDADSEGVEGRFYVWSEAEVRDALGADADLFCRVYDVTAAGNFEGANILHLERPLDAVARDEGIPLAELEERMTSARRTLRERRSERVAPFRDEKVIVSWNGFAIRAFAEVGAALGRLAYVDFAREAGDFIWAELRREDVLLHSWIGGRASGPGFLDDYAALGNACLSLHAATLDPVWFARARQLAREILDRFVDPDTGVLHDTSNDAERLVLRPRDPMDTATPSGASLAAELFARLAPIGGAERVETALRSILRHEAAALERFGPAFGRMLSVVDRVHASSLEVAIGVPADDEGTGEAMIRAAHAVFMPGGVIAGYRGSPGALAGTPLFEGREEPVDGRATAWVCEGHACDLPRADAAEVEARLRVR